MLYKRCRRILLFLLLGLLTGVGLAEDSFETVVFIGTFQSEVGCSGDWQPECELTIGVEADENAFYALEVNIPEGEYEYRVALDSGWEITFGVEGTEESPNYELLVPDGGALVAFVFDAATHVVDVSLSDPVLVEDGATTGAEEIIIANPVSVTIAGTIQPQLGCDSEWAPPCEDTFLNYDAESDIWKRSFEIEAGEYEYKAALEGGWGWNYGINALRDGPNIGLVLEEDSTVTFYFDVKSGWITDDVNSIIANVAGSFQDEVGCSGEWLPACFRTWLQDVDGDGIYTYQVGTLPAGEYEAKVALDGSWDVNYGAEGAANGENIAFSVPEASLVSFEFDSTTNLLAVSSSPLPASFVIISSTAPEIQGGPLGPANNPNSVTIAGTVQSQLGCDSDWSPPCEATFLAYDEPADIWRATFALEAGDYEYKAALNGAWDENYGIGASPGGANIPLSLTEAGDVQFLYDHKSNWITDSINSVVATVPGSFQDEIGCSADWSPDCYASWLQDPDGDGVYVFATTLIPPGNYEAKVAIDGSWAVNYGEDGVEGGSNIPFTVTEDGSEVTFIFNAETKVLRVISGGGLRGNIGQQRAYWIAADTIIWNAEDPDEDTSYLLFSSPTGNLSLSPEGLEGGASVELSVASEPLDGDLAAKFPHLTEATVLKIAEEDLAGVPEILRGQVAIAAVNAEGIALDATGLQIAGVLDDLYTTDAPLGVHWTDDVPSISVWAPTAQNVSLHLFDDLDSASESAVLPMTRDEANGVWTIVGEEDWRNKAYLFEVVVYAPSTGDVETNLVTDPYSMALAINSTRSLIVDLNSDDLKPAGWDGLEKPALASMEDITIYELHIRDFSIYDASVPEELRGKYGAFAIQDSSGVTHLKKLADAGLSHLHLLPSFDIATIEEDVTQQVNPDPEVLASFPPDSEEQQALISTIRDQDGFNWGYDPYHFNVPEGSYSTEPDGIQRIIEYREMVQALNAMGLRVVTDVVYNHTNASGQSARSVFDRIVPGYYYRLNPSGGIYTNTCCPGTASETNMFERFMLDSLRLWATQYKIDAFRFDLMGYHTLDNMIKIREMLDSLTIEEDGVDGKSIYVYGEGWNPGDVPDDARGVRATQLNLGGVGIGTFTDRLRDAARGGNPFGGLQDQGFINGLFVNPNGLTSGEESEQRERLLLFQDQIRIGLTGNLANYSFTSRSGDIITGAEVPYGDAPAGYALDPQEVVTYVSKHDNETLFDIIQLKAPVETTMSDRVRMQNLALSLVAYSQGVPFFHAGSDMLRSKSLDRDSYNSGDWFNALDFTYETNNWSRGLPSANVGSNRENWSIFRPLLGMESLKPEQGDIVANAEYFKELLQIRYSSKLFRLENADQIQDMVDFYNTGVNQIPGLIVMGIRDTEDIDPQFEAVLVIFNANTDEVEYTISDFLGSGYELHSVLVNSVDETSQLAAFDNETGTFTVPGITASVFVLPRE